MSYLASLGELALGSRLKALSDALYDRADEIYRARGLSLQSRWFPVLRVLHDQGPRAVGEVAREIGQTHSAVSQLAAQLKRGGWLRVARDPTDGRRSVLTLTDRAQDSLRAAKPVWRAMREELSARLVAAEAPLLSALTALERAVVDPPIAHAILARCAASNQQVLRIVPFRPELRAHFYRINAAWLKKFFLIEPVDRRVLRNPEREIIEHGGAIWFAKSGDRVVGTCALKHHGEGVYEVTKMGVDEGCQGLGVGRALLDAAIAEFRRRRGRELFLESNRKLTPALRLYESAGFEHQPHARPGSVYQRSDVYMIWRDTKAPRRDRSRAKRRPAP
jgi:DNA-binding MarR family transcriptional regulator/ribosomal protein S18 acetylase RimI-like enzyme